MKRWFGITALLLSGVCAAIGNTWAPNVQSGAKWSDTGNWLQATVSAADHCPAVVFSSVQRRTYEVCVDENVFIRR
ncbi:MAG: hypothetical protein AB7E95_12310, partial [Kiritimatiellales bacterium]